MLIVGANADIVASSAATRAKVVAASTAGSTTAAAALVAGSTKVLKWGSVIGAVVGYEGVKKFSAYNQQVTQLGVNAGISAKQLPALAAGFMKVSDATGMSATNVASMAYYLASANPKIKTTTASLLAMTSQAASLSVLAGNSSNPTAISRMYGAIVSNAIPLVAGGKAPTYSTASGTALNMWANAVTGHGDMTVGGLVGAAGDRHPACGQDLRHSAQRHGRSPGRALAGHEPKRCRHPFEDRDWDAGFSLIQGCRGR